MNKGRFCLKETCDKDIHGKGDDQEEKQKSLNPVMICRKESDQEEVEVTLDENEILSNEMKKEQVDNGSEVGEIEVECEWKYRDMIRDHLETVKSKLFKAIDDDTSVIVSELSESEGETSESGDTVGEIDEAEFRFLEKQHCLKQELVTESSVDLSEHSEDETGEQVNSHSDSEEIRNFRITVNVDGVRDATMQETERGNRSSGLFDKQSENHRSEHSDTEDKDIHYKSRQKRKIAFRDEDEDQAKSRKLFLVDDSANEIERMISENFNTVLDQELGKITLRKQHRTSEHNRKGFSETSVGSSIKSEHLDFLEFDKRSGKSLCSICKVTVANNFNNLQEHAAGKKHLENKKIIELQSYRQKKKRKLSTPEEETSTDLRKVLNDKKSNNEITPDRRVVITDSDKKNNNSSSVKDLERTKKPRVPIVWDLG